MGPFANLGYRSDPMTMCLLPRGSSYFEIGKNSEHNDSSKFNYIGKYRHTFHVLSALAILSVISIFCRSHITDKQLILLPGKYGFDTTLPRKYAPVWTSNLE